MLFGRHIIALQQSSARCCELTTCQVSQPRMCPVPYAMADFGEKWRPAMGALQTVAKYARSPPYNHVLTAVRVRLLVPYDLRYFLPVTQLNWIRWTRRSAGPASPFWTWCGRTKRVRIARSPWVQSWHCCCLHNCATAETGWSASPMFATQVLRQAYLGA